MDVFTLNNDSIKYEVALEILGQNMQKYINTIADERSKEIFSQQLIDYCEACLTAIHILQDDLRVEDVTTVNMILNPNDKVFGIRT